ncbi:MAG TPA: DUF1573 domain-containing protein, partial [Candidatus Cloacimonadota bacterium]|nr:DUF1573 domain-containing protein [Candidatus Cloacimonadota bacterium]
PVSQPHIAGFTIRSGSGRRIIQNEGGSTIEKRVGGGIYIRQANPMFSYNRIEDNDADDEGGGSYAFQSLPNFGGMVNAAVGIRNPGANYFRNNHADIGSDIYIHGVTTRDNIKLQNCSFEVFSSADTTLSNYWVTSSAPLSFSGCGGLVEAITADIWVATNGSDTLNDGLSPLSPFKTIDHALSRIYATAENPLVIHIASGTYSPSLTGEKFPLQMVKHVSLRGSGREETFLDAEGSADFPRRVLNLDKVEGVQVSGLTLMNGFVTLAKNYNGGAIGILASQVALSDLIVAGSSAAGNGAGIYALDSSVEADSLVIQYNSALGSGGGIHTVQTNLNLSQSSVINNSVSKNGAGLSLDGGAIAVNDCEISYNQATGYQSKGGGISLSGTQDALFKANLITHNNADNGAGAYLQDNSAFHLDRNRFTNNLADYSGGGLFINTSSGLITNNLIAGNTASQRGGALYCYSAPLIINNTIASNKAGLQGGALYLNSASPSVTNTILWGNVQGNPEVPNQIYLFGDAADPEITFSDVQGGYSAFGSGGEASYTGTYLDNQDQDPLFTDTPEGAGHYFEIGQASLNLSDESPAIDAGDPGTDFALFPLDIACNPRLDNARVDLGAWEAVHFVGARIVANPAAVDYGRVNISGEPVQRQISISNTGNQALLISDITLETPATEFTWTFSGLGSSILPGESLILEASFDPQQVGLVSNALLLSSNSLNSPILRIPLRGYGIDASSSQPSNVVLQVSGYDVNISWDPVLSDPLGNPFTPEGYIVLYSETINATLDDYLYLTFSTGTSAVHTAVARFQDRMFYRVIAVDGSTRATLENLLSAAQRTRQLSWREIKLLLQNSRTTLQTSSSPLSKER